MTLGGYILSESGQRNQLTQIGTPNVQDVEKYLSVLCRSCGVLSLGIDPPPEIGPYELVLYAEAGNFLLMLNGIDSDGEECVRTCTSEQRENVLIEILGESFPNRAVTNDFSFVRTVFAEFRVAGNVSVDVLR